MPDESRDSGVSQMQESRLLTDNEWKMTSDFCKQLAPGLLALDGERDSAPTVTQAVRRYGVSLPAYKPVNAQGQPIAAESDVVSSEVDQSTCSPSRQTAPDITALSE